MQGDVVVRRLIALLAAVFVVAVLAALPQLASPAAGAAMLTSTGSVVPTTLTAGGQTRFCGDGFVKRADVEVFVGDQPAARVTASDTGRFCVELQAQPYLQAGAAQLAAVGDTDKGQRLKVVGKVAIAKASALSSAPVSRMTPLVSASRPFVVHVWVATAVAAVTAGAFAIVAQRRRHPLPVAAE